MIREMIQNQFGELEGKIWNDLFQTELVVEFPSVEEQEYAQRCAEYFSHMPDDMVDRLCVYCNRYCDAFRRFFGEEDFEVPAEVSGREILSYVTPGRLIVELAQNSDALAFHVECECEWEPEHGLEITINSAKILYVGPYEGVSPYDEVRIKSIGFFENESDFCSNYADQE